MSYLKRFAGFWYDFVVGDDWLIAVGVVASLAVAAALARGGLEVAGVMVLPLGVAATLGVSAARGAKGGG